MARPSSYSQVIADTICERLVDGESLRAICQSDAMPSKGTVMRWLSENQPFQDQYTHARTAQADTIFDEIIDIADDGSNDWMQRTGKDEEPQWVFNGEAARRSQIRIDARKWMAGKLRPKKYGDKMEIEARVENINVVIGGDA